MLGNATDLDLENEAMNKLYQDGSVMYMYSKSRSAHLKVTTPITTRNGMQAGKQRVDSECQCTMQQLELETTHSNCGLQSQRHK